MMSVKLFIVYLIVNKLVAIPMMGGGIVGSSVAYQCLSFGPD
jgi:hypothetical protein